ncbi:MAG: glycosyltransferase [Bacilli bacterium]
MKKILITQSDLTIGGIQKSLINLLNQLDYTKYKVDLVLFEKKGELLNEVPSEVNIISIKEKYNLTLSKKERILKEVFSYKSFFNKLYKNLKDETRYDVAIAFDGYVSFSDYYAAFSNAAKKVIWVHSDFYSRKKFQFKFKIKLFSLKDKYQYFDQIVAVSNSAQEGFIKVFPKNKEKTTYIWNFMEAPKKDFLIEEPDIIFNKDYFNIISIGALLPVKGYERLIKVQTKLNKNGFNTKMYILGDGQQRKKLEKLIKKNNLEDSFILLGRRKDVYPILKQADLFVSSSYYEGFGVVLLESLSLGVPILVPRISGVSDIAKYIAPENSAKIVENSVEGLYDGIIEYINESKKTFKFDLNDYNRKVLNEIEKILN